MQVRPLSFSLYIMVVVSACTPGPPLHQGMLHLAHESPFIDITVHDCHDGDTCLISLNNPFLPPVFGQHIPVRLYGINTWEMQGRCQEETTLAIQARDFLKLKIAKGVRVDLVNPQRDKYFRLLGYLVVDGENMSEALLKAGHAHPYFGGKKPPPPCQP